MKIKTNGHLSDEITLTEDDLECLSGGGKLEGSGVVVKKEEPLTYSVGDRFRMREHKVILVSLWLGEEDDRYVVGLARLSSGINWNGAFAVDDPSRITRSEIRDNIGSLTRYWDARKQEKI